MRGQLDVHDLIVPRKNVLSGEMVKTRQRRANKAKNKQDTDFNRASVGADKPTFRATISWDWIHTVRGRNIGIWNDVKLVSTGNVTVSDPLVESVFPLPDTTSVRLTAHAFVKNHSDKEVQGVLEGSIGTLRFAQ